MMAIRYVQLMPLKTITIKIQIDAFFLLGQHRTRAFSLNGQMLGFFKLAEAKCSREFVTVRDLFSKKEGKERKRQQTPIPEWMG